MTVSAKQGQHLTREQKAEIRYEHPGASDLALARKYGVRAATIRLVRDTAQVDHAARLARFRGFPGGGGGARVTRAVVPATRVREPKPNTFIQRVTDAITMRTADGHDIPQTMR